MSAFVSGTSGAIVFSGDAIKVSDEAAVRAEDAAEIAIDAANDANDAADRAEIYGPLTFPDIQSFFSSSIVDSGAIGKRAGTQNGSAVWSIVSPGSGDFNHPITGVGVIVLPVSGALVMDAFGVFPDNEAFSASNQVGMGLVRAAVSAIRGRVVRPATQGVYWFPTNTLIAAPGMRLEGGGATMKQQSGSQTTNWLQVAAADGFQIDNWVIDGNRANAPSLANDSAILLVTNISGARFSNLKVHSSSAKGMALASGVAGNGVKNVSVINCQGWNCRTQAFMTDRSNSGAGDTIPCEDVLFDGITVGATDHAGIAVNDGSRRITVVNSFFDVQNSAWDAVSIRGSRQVKVSNTVGRRGRNGCQISVLDNAAIARGEIADGIQLSGNTWSENRQTGCLIAGATDVRVVGDISKNNGQNGTTQYGFAVTQIASVRQSSDVALTSVVAIDDQAVPTQHTGIIALACSRVKVSDPTMRGNTAFNKVQYNSTAVDFTVSGDGLDGATQKKVSATTGTVSASSFAIVPISFVTAFASVPRSVQVSIQSGTTGASLRIDHITAITAAGVNVRVTNTVASDQVGTIYVDAEL